MFKPATSQAPPPIEPSSPIVARWHELDEAGKTLRDRVVEKLREQSPTEEHRDLSGIRLIGEDLSGVDLSGADLSHANLSRANLVGAKLIGANLTRAVLNGADLSEAECMKANFSHTDLSECTAKRTGFGHCNLKRASFFSAKVDQSTMSDADLYGADLRGASLNEVRLRKANLTRADLSRAELKNADLEHANVSHAQLVQADLRAARLRQLRNFGTAVFLHSDIRDVDFSGAYLLRSQIMDENYLDEFKSHSLPHRITYWIWWATSDCGRSVLRFSAWVGVITALFGFLYSFLDINYGAQVGPLTPYYFSWVTLTTLGYGDVLPASTMAQAAVMAEVFVGYMSLGGMLSIFSNKMARRAE